MSFSCLLWLFISIHAPPRGATGGTGRAELPEHISIHAPPRGATAAARNCPDSSAGFQFTPLREGRRLPAYGKRRGAHFNSRPSARGDEEGMTLSGSGLDIFQFTPLREGRQILREFPFQTGLFQFTPLREGRHETVFCLLLPRFHFNSRPSARGDTPPEQ